jgi:hypothetical protein
VQDITASALTHARRKLLPDVFLALNKVLLDSFYNPAHSRTKKVIKRILGVDGSRIDLPDTKEIVNEFGRANKQTDAKPQGLASALFDIVNKLMIDVSLNPCCGSENHIAIDHIEQVGSGDLLIFDRGYKCRWLMAAILAQGADFLIRLPKNAFKEITTFIESMNTDIVITLHHSKDSLETCSYLGIDTTPLKVRLVKVFLDSGETEILITSLLDQSIYNYCIFKDLYHLRWGIEEEFKTIKAALEVESFTGQSVHAVYQEFYASVFLSNLQSVITNESDVLEEIECISSRRKYDYQENRTSALFYLKEKLISLFTLESFDKILKYIKEKIVENILPIRPGRKFERKFPISKPKKYMRNRRALA